MAFTYGGEYVITATAKNITDALTLDEKKYCKQIIIRNATGATAALYLGNDDVTATTNRHTQIAAGAEVYLDAWDSAGLHTSEIYLVGTANAANIAFITLIT